MFPRQRTCTDHQGLSAGSAQSRRRYWRWQRTSVLCATVQGSKWKDFLGLSNRPAASLAWKLWMLPDAPEICWPSLDQLSLHFWAGPLLKTGLERPRSIETATKSSAAQLFSEAEASHRIRAHSRPETLVHSENVCQRHISHELRNVNSQRQLISVPSKDATSQEDLTLVLLVLNPCQALHASK